MHGSHGSAPSPEQPRPSGTGPAAPGPDVFAGRGIQVLVVPFLVYLIAMAAVGAAEPLLPGGEGSDSAYAWGYAIGLVLTLTAMTWAGRGYLHAPFRLTWLGPAVGLVGIAVWVGLWWVDREFLGLGDLLGASREGFDPLTAFGENRLALSAFLGIRFVGLVAVVPIIEEFFVRGFLMRYVESRHWDRIPLGSVTALSAGAVVVYAVASHPAEPLAAMAWFSMVTWLYARTRSIWDCVAAHATTNLLLGIYVLATGTWALW